MEAVIEDIMPEQTMLEDESFEYQFFVECPICSHKNIQKNIPSKIADRILNGE